MPTYTYNLANLLRGQRARVVPLKGLEDRHRTVESELDPGVPETNPSFPLDFLFVGGHILELFRHRNGDLYHNRNDWTTPLFIED